jgi:hypothetical protein
VIAGVGALCAIPLTWWAKLARDTNKELTPSLHWSEPYVSGDSYVKIKNHSVSVASADIRSFIEVIGKQN